MKNLKQFIADAENEQVAIGHFNITSVEMFWGIFKVAQKHQVPVIIGVSEGERDHLGVRQIASFIKSVKEEYDFPVFLNADHTYSFERVKEVVDAGFDSVIFDGAMLSLEENITETKKCVEYARSVDPNILVESEIGYIGSSSKVLEELPEGAAVTKETVTKPEEAKRFVEETGVDLLAPAVGTVHGMMRKGLNPKLHIDRIKEIREACGVPLVLHGGSGSSDEDIRSAVLAGISQVHISTEIRRAYRKGIEEALQEDSSEIAPYRYMSKSIEKVSEVVEQKLGVINRKLKI